MTISKRKRLKIITEYLSFKGEKSVDEIQLYVESKIIGPFDSANLKRSIYRDIDSLEQAGQLTKNFYDMKTGKYIDDPDSKKKYIMKCHSVIDSSFIVGEDLLKDLGINFIPSFNKPEAWKVSIVKDKKQPRMDSFCFVFKFKEKYICIEAEIADAPLSLVISGCSKQKIDSDYLISRFGNAASLLQLPLETLLPIDSITSGHTIIHFNNNEFRGDEFIRVNYAFRFSKNKFIPIDDISIYKYLTSDVRSGWVSWSRANDFIEDANFEGILNHYNDGSKLTWFEKKSLALNRGNVSKMIATPKPKGPKKTLKKVASKSYEVESSRMSLTNSFYKLHKVSGDTQQLPLRLMSGGLEFIVFVAYKNPKELILKKAA